MENNMFCFQCQETAKGFGCTLKGVCGKKCNYSTYHGFIALCSTRNFCCGGSIAPAFPPR